MAQNEQLSMEIVGTLPSPEALDDAVAEITSSGWDRSELSLLAQHHVFGEEVVGDTHKAAVSPRSDDQAVVAEDDVRQGRTLAAGMAGVVGAFVASGATILTGGTALAAIVGAAVVGGGAAAAVEGVAGMAGQNRDRFVHEQLEKGGILLWVRMREPGDEAQLRDIFSRHGATDIRVHPVPSEYADEPEGKAGPKRA